MEVAIPGWAFWPNRVRLGGVLFRGEGQWYPSQRPRSFLGTHGWNEDWGGLSWLGQVQGGALVVGSLTLCHGSHEVLCAKEGACVYDRVGVCLHECGDAMQGVPICKP